MGLPLGRTLPSRRRVFYVPRRCSTGVNVYQGVAAGVASGGGGGSEDPSASVGGAGGS